MSSRTNSNLKSQFVASIFQGIRYWALRTEDISEEALVQLEDDWHNLTRIIQYGQQRPELHPELAALILNTYHFVERRALWQEWIPLMQKAVTWAQINTVLHGQLLNRLGALYRHNHQYSEALATHEEAKKIIEPLSEPLLLNHIYFNMCADYRHQRQYERAVYFGELALEGFKAIQAPLKWQAAALNELGLIAQAQGHLDIAERRYEASIEAWKEVGQQTELLRALNNMVGVSRAKKDYSIAIDQYEQAEAFFTEDTHEFEKTSLRINLGGVYYDLAEYDQAERVFRQANSRYLQKSNHFYYRALVNQCLGITLFRQNQFDEAVVYLEESARGWQMIADELMLANTLGTLAEIMAEIGDQQKASELYDEALAYLVKFPEDAWAKKLHREFSEQKQA